MSMFATLATTPRSCKQVVATHLMQVAAATPLSPVGRGELQ